jgi:hypothetical protein
MNPAADSALARVFTGAVVRRNLVLALVVGTILNAINQGDAIAAGTNIIWWRFGLNYVVPFLVSSFGAWNAGRPRG